jgi:hypothetical protein
MIRPFGSVAAVVALAAVAAAVGVLTGRGPATDDLALKRGKGAEASEIEGGHTKPF